MAMGRPKAMLVLDSELREQLGKLGQLAFSSGGAGASVQDYFAECFWEDELGDCAATGDQQGHGRRGTRGANRAPGTTLTATPELFCDQGAFFVLAGKRLLRSSMACSKRWRRFQKSPQRSPFSFRRAKTVFMFNASGRKPGRNSRGNRGAETGACGKARTEYAAARGRPWAFC